VGEWRYTDRREDGYERRRYESMWRERWRQQQKLEDEIFASATEDLRELNEQPADSHHRPIVLPPATFADHELEDF
jgi:hypothetical protein